MAKNYTITEAVEIIAKGEDLESIVDIGRRFPILLAKASKVAAKAGDDFVDFMKFMPEHVTANKVNSNMKALIAETDTDTDSDDENETEAKEKVAKPSKTKSSKTDSDDVTDYESMNGATLFALVKERGLKPKLNGNNKKANLIKVLKEADNTGEVVADDADGDEIGKDERDSYDDMTALELFKECKKRGIKATPKKKEKYYIELLKKNDAESEAESDSDDDWDDDEEEEVKPKKKESKSNKKSKDKKVKEEEPEDEEDDDDWDI